MTDTIRMTCPCCGERIEIIADGSGGDADYIEDCPVCCQPINLHIGTDADGELTDWRAADDR
jgi:hypothetical protein